VEEQIEALPDANQLPQVEQAKEIIKAVPEDKLAELVAKVGQEINSELPEGEELPEGVVSEAMVTESVKAIVDKLKGLADPKVIMAVITLMGAINSTEASKFTDAYFYNQEHTASQMDNELKNKIMAEFDSAPTVESGYAHVVVDGKHYFVGKGTSPISKFAKDEAEENADKAALKATDIGTEEAELKLLDYSEDIVNSEKQAIVIMGIGNGTNL